MSKPVNKAVIGAFILGALGLLLAGLHAMKEHNYAYAVISWAGPADFYTRMVGAVPIEGSAPGYYRGPLIGS